MVYMSVQKWRPRRISSCRLASVSEESTWDKFLLNHWSNYRALKSLLLPSGIIPGFSSFCLHCLASFQHLITVHTTTAMKLKVLWYISTVLNMLISGEKCRLLYLNQSASLTLWFVEEFLEFDYSNTRVDIENSSDDLHPNFAYLPA